MRMRMRGWSTNNRVLATALAAFVGIAVVSYVARPTPPVPYASTSAAPDGTLALYRWVAALGYSPQRLTARPLQLEGVRALVVVEPRAPFSASDIARTLRWVRGGGTLILLTDGGDAGLPGALGVAMTPLPVAVSRPVPYGAAPVQPLLAHPPLRGLSLVATASVNGAAPGIVPVLGVGGLREPGTRPNAPIAAPDASHPALVYEQFGRGQVYAGSTPAVVTNGTIAAGDNRRLIPNLLAALPSGGRVGFDDAHLVVPSSAEPAGQAPATLTDALTSTGWGRALLYACALVAAYVVLTGRRLGRPLRPVPERGRSLAEYVVSMAAIFRRAGLRARVLLLWQDDLRRALAGAGGARRRADADADLVAEAGRRVDLTPAEQEEALALLRSRPALAESTLVALCQRIDRLQHRLSSRG